ncbi:uncharacterized protein LOC135349969 [Halichondria panicea]|uniref:uncharacterized protein LOC135349969 n=1 Tax=Halichondria panicea TaxID=6063 RepID=UPI00312BA83D
MNLRSTSRLIFKGVKLLSARAVTVRSMAYSIEERGSQYSLDYRVYFKKGDKYVSPFHDVPLYANAEKTVYNAIMEVPRWSNAKMEISVADKLNPIKQDVKKGKARFVSNVFPYHGYMWNYGALPQTWEDPSHMDPNTNCKGDNDPLDVCEIGYRVAKRGEVRQVKVLGCVALIDEGETDWKVLAIDVTDPLAEKLNDVSDIETEMPGFLAATVEWFTKYKVPAGKPKNNFAFNGKAMDKDFTTRIVAETHDQWEKLMKNQHSDPTSISRANTTVAGDYLVSQTDAAGVVATSPPPAPDTPIDPIVDKWHYVQ